MGQLSGRLERNTLMASSWSIGLTLHYRSELGFALQKKKGAINGVKEKVAGIRFHLSVSPLMWFSK